MGWVHGGGSVVGMLAEMLAGGLNANLGGRDHIPIEVERQVTEWMRQLFRISGRLVRIVCDGLVDREFYRPAHCTQTQRAKKALHRRAPRAIDEASGGLHVQRRARLHRQGNGNVRPGERRAPRSIPVDEQHRIRIPELRRAIDADRSAGLIPFLIVGTAGTVDIGAIDDLDGLSDLASEEKMWFHVDGALGALAILAPDLEPQLRGIERADSIAFDFHKWAQVPYDAGFVLVRDGKQHARNFLVAGRIFAEGVARSCGRVALALRFRS